MSRPDFDPWLSHLRKDRRGLAIPYVNLRGAESTDRMRVAYDRHVGQRAVFLDDSAEQVPDFTKANMGRQRECVATGLCQVCARPVPWSRRNLVVSGVSVQWVPLGGKRVPVVFEPWLDDRCAEIAIKWCPALIRRTRSDDLHLIRVRSQRDAQLVVSTGWIDGHLEAETKADPVAMWCKVALLNTRIMPADLAAVGG